MDFVEAVKGIPGPEFLIFFGLLSLLLLFAGRWFANLDGSGGYPLPDPTRFDSLAVAALRGGWAAAIRTAVFSLWKRELVAIDKDAKKQIGLTAHRHGVKIQPGVESAVLSFLRTPRKPRELFTDRELRERVESELAPIYREMEQMHLLRTEGERSKGRSTMLIVALIIAGIGGLKLFLGITGNRPSLYLALLLVVLLFVWAFIYNRQPRLTALGNRYLRTLEEQFEWLKEPAGGRDISGIDPALPIAIFGAGMLDATSSDALYAEAFRASSKQNGGCGGGCGGSTGGCGGGSDGGSSDGGGGGCGGCGGGGD